MWHSNSSLTHYPHITQPPQERNAHHPDGGPGASRLTATVRRGLASLGVALDSLRERTVAAMDV